MSRPVSETRVYLGSLPRNIVERRDIEKFFYGYGDIEEIKLMSGFAFVEFKDPRDAKDAVQDLGRIIKIVFYGSEVLIDGKKILGDRINIEFARGERDRRNDFRNRDPDVRYPRPRRTGYRVIVENLSQNVSWQVSQFCLFYFCRIPFGPNVSSPGANIYGSEGALGYKPGLFEDGSFFLPICFWDLKDFMRTAGEVTYADCSRDGSGKGIVEFETEEDVRAAVRKLDGVDFKGSEVILHEDLDLSRPRSRSPRRNRSLPRYRNYDKGYDRYDRHSPRYRRDDRDPYYRRDEYSGRRGFRDDRYSRGISPYNRSPLRDRSRERSPGRSRERSQTRSPVRSPVRSPRNFSPRDGSVRSPIDHSIRERSRVLNI
ncbi:hypothetical protein PMAC_002072 [Pneumocystis sp. 'macacae']|nr:hypothetical protein PMAC_002072 [Pneumocystis sp. 'macacae']